MQYYVPAIIDERRFDVIIAVAGISPRTLASFLMTIEYSELIFFNDY